MEWILGLLIVLILIIIYNNKQQRKRKKILVDTLKTTWGMPRLSKDYNFDKISQYHNAIKDNQPSFQNITSTINNDLDLDDIYIYLDRTTSVIGQQYLYHKLHTIESKESVRTLDDLIDFFILDNEERLKIQILLSPLSNKNAYHYHSLFTTNVSTNSFKLKLAYTLNIITACTLLLSIYSLAWSMLLLPILSINLVLHYKNKYTQYDHLNATQYFKYVHRTNIKLQNITKLSKAYNFKEAKTANNKLHSLYKLTHFFNTENVYKDEITSLVMFPVEILKIMLNIETIAFETFLITAKKTKKELTISFETIAKIDIAISLASLHANNKLCKPTFKDTKELDVEDLAHPLIEKCTTNTLQLKNKSFLLTGSNMSGKTTFIRTLALNTILAQTIGFVFATKYTADFFHINTSIRITDDLYSQTSYYLQEVKQLKHFIKQSQINIPHLYVLDEILKGTNTIERISAAYAILKYLNKERDIVIVSTHDLELIDLLKEKGYQCHYLQESIINNELNFDYKLKLGHPITTNAIKILELHDFPKEITDLAYTTKKMFS